MNVPPDIQIPDIIADLPPLSRRREFTKLIERISLEARTLFKRAARNEKLQIFKAKWSEVEDETLAARLAYFDTLLHDDPKRILYRDLMKDLPKYSDKSVPFLNNLVVAAVQRLGDNASRNSIVDEIRATNPRISPDLIHKSLKRMAREGYLRSHSEVAKSIEGSVERHYSVTKSGRSVDQIIFEHAARYNTFLDSYRSKLNLPKSPRSL